MSLREGGPRMLRSLFGVLVSPQEYRKIGFGSVSVLSLSGLTSFIRQSIEALAPFHPFFYVKVTSDPSSYSNTYSWTHLE